MNTDHEAAKQHLLNAYTLCCPSPASIDRFLAGVKEMEIHEKDLVVITQITGSLYDGLRYNNWV